MAATGDNKRGKVVIISGPSGVGKSTVCHRLCESIPARFSVSVTTRPPRPGEANARDYHYISHDEFASLRDNGGLLEFAEVYGNMYGTPAAPVREAIATGEVSILEIDINGCIQVRKAIPETKTFFMMPPSPDEQRRRIEDRKTDPADAIRERLSKADGETRYAMDAGCYDVFIINDDLDETVQTIRDSILKE